MGNVRRRLIAAQPHLVTASGSSVLVTIAEPKIERLKVTFAPVQTGSGTPSPSNVRPIYGWSEIPVGITPGYGDVLEAVPEGKYGTIDLSTGVMTVTHTTYTVSSSTSITSSSVNFMYFNVDVPMKVSSTAPHPEGFCNKIEVITTRPRDRITCLFGTYDSGTAYRYRVYVYDIDKAYPEVTTKEAAQAKLIELAPTVVYELQTPYTVQLSGITPRTGTVTISPFQYGGGTPSPTNVRPIIPVVDGPSISLGGTYYGGTVDLVSGVMTVTWGNIASYAGETLTGRWLSSKDAYSAGGTPTTGAQVAYELATPQTVTLTPQTIAALRGQQTVTSPAGAVEISYWTN